MTSVSSPAPFNALDWPHDIELEQVTVPAGWNPTTQQFNEETETVVQIAGHFDANPEEAEARSSQAPLEEGEARLFTDDTRVNKDSRVRIHLDDSGTNYDTYRVMDKVREHGVLMTIASFSPRRVEWRLLKEVR